METIEERNRRVEADKAWETSAARRLLIASGTYVIVCFYLRFLGVENFVLHALVPAGAYLISTLSLPVFKKLWLRHCYKNQDPA